MKYFLTVIAFAILGASAQTQGMQTSRAKKEIRAETIWLGTAIHLGMQKVSALKDLAQNYQTVQVSGRSDIWLVEARDNPQELVGSIEFSNDRVFRVSRMWASGDEDGFGTARAIHSAIKHLNDEGYTNCVISSDTSSAPENEQKNVSIRCGAKSLRISVFDVVSGKAKGKYFGIDEVLE